MTRVTLSARDRRTLLSGVVIVGMLIASRGLPAITRWRSDRIAENAATIATAARAITDRRALPQMRAARDSVARRLAVDSAMIVGRSAAELSATLAQIVAAVADECGVRLGTVSLEEADSVAAAGIQLVSPRVRASLTGDLQSVTLLVARLEAGAPMLVVRRIAIAQSEANPPRDRPEVLRVELLVAAIGRIERSATRGAAE